MAEFTESQLILISEVLGITRDSLNSQLVYLGSRVTQAVVDRIVVHLNAWSGGIGSNFIEVHPNTANFGAKISPNLAREQIQNNLRALLEFGDHYGEVGASDRVYLERG